MRTHLQYARHRKGAASIVVLIVIAVSMIMGTATAGVIFGREHAERALWAGCALVAFALVMWLIPLPGQKRHGH